MKQLILAGSLLLLAAFIVVIPVERVLAQDLVIKEKSYDFGDVKENAVLEHTFRILNQGGREVRITRVKPDCGCTTPSYDPVIPPGGEASVTLRLDTRGFDGKISKHTRVSFAGSDLRGETLTLEGYVVVPIRLSKGHAVFKGRAGDAITKTIEIKARGDKPLKLETSAFDLEDKMRLTIEEVESGRTFHLHLTNIPGPPDTFHGTLTLKTNYPEKPEIRIKIRARFSPNKAG